jgi:ABC-2 type transport system ATP-binding protein
MPVIDVRNLSYSYGRTTALRDLSFAVPDGALYALLGPNGSGKTTLLQILIGVRRALAGQVSLLGVDSTALSRRDRGRISYVAESQSLPAWMRLEQLEAYLAPLYPAWDAALARDLRLRFDLDPRRRIGTLSRGERMKAALLCALAPRPQLLLMDEPFTGMDVVVKDELVRGLLESAGREGWSVLIASHDIGELEQLADWVGFLAEGRMRVSEPMERLRQRFKRVTIVGAELPSGAGAVEGEWLCVARAGRRLRFITSEGDDDYEARMRRRFPDAERIEVENASLREIFVALASPASEPVDDVVRAEVVA